MNNYSINEIHQCNKNIRHFGLYGLDGVSKMNALEVFNHNKTAIRRYQLEAAMSVVSNPNHQYPKNYQSGNEHIYWEEKITNLQDAYLSNSLIVQHISPLCLTVASRLKGTDYKLHFIHKVLMECYYGRLTLEHQFKLDTLQFASGEVLIVPICQNDDISFLQLNDAGTVKLSGFPVYLYCKNLKDPSLMLSLNNNLISGNNKGFYSQYFDKLMEAVKTSDISYHETPNSDLDVLIKVKEGKATDYVIRNTKIFYSNERLASMYCQICNDFIKWLDLIQQSEVVTPFKQLFKNQGAFDKIIELLSLQSLINKQSNIWIDNQKGSKSFLVAIIKDLHPKGYYKGSKPSNSTIQNICLRFFKVDVSIDTVKKASPSKFDLSFIQHLE